MKGFLEGQRLEHKVLESLESMEVEEKDGSGTGQEDESGMEQDREHKEVEFRASMEEELVDVW